MQYINSYATLDTRLYHKQVPTPLLNPRQGHFNPIVAHQLRWDEDAELMRDWVDILAGNKIPDGFDPLAMAYAGHQFGQWAGQLGDGRGLLMAQVKDRNGQLTDLHLKGAGLTPYSRMGDGRAVLRSTIREYLCGHAMSALGIRSSNALGLIISDTKVRRETIEQGAALMRVADSHIRLGHVEWITNFAPDLLASFTRYMIETYFADITTSTTPVLDFISAVIARTAVMIADWQLIGFAHGVMNTDNLSITGATIDYGPFGFMERFNPSWINNHSDYTGRYAYQNQPAIGHWNLNIWMMHFMSLSGKKVIGDTVESISREKLTQCLESYETRFIQHYQYGVCKKLGLPWFDEEPQYKDLTNQTLKLAFEFLEIIETNHLDYTNSWRALIAVVAMAQSQQEEDKLKQEHKYEQVDSNECEYKYDYEQSLLNTLEDELDEQQLKKFQQWQHAYHQHINTYLKAVAHLNPKYKDSHCDNKSKLNNAKHMESGKHMNNNIEHLSIPHNVQHVIAILQQTNPVYVLRNAMAQRAIAQAESGDFSEVDRLFHILAQPYDVHESAHPTDTAPPAKGAKPLVISCSS